MTIGSPRGALWAAITLPVLILIAPARPVAADTWTTYAYPNDISGIALSDGVLWMSTTGGALRYDPSDGSFRQFPRRITGGPVSQNLTSVCRDESGLIYFGSADKGVVTYDAVADRWRRFDEIPNNEIQRVACIDGDVYIATASGFAIRRPPTEICNDIDRGCCGLSDQCDFPSFDVRDFTVLAGDIWAATAGGPARFRDDAWHARSVGLPSTDARSVAAFGTDVFVALPSAAGVYRWNASLASWAAAADGLRGSQSLGDRVRLVNSDGTLFLCCQYGLFQWTGSAWIGTGLEDVEVRDALSLPSPGYNLYAATADGLQARRDTGPTTTWTLLRASGPPSRVPNQSIEAAADGTIWVGTIGGPMRRDPDGNWTVFPDGVGGLLPSDVYDLFVDRASRLWVGKCCCPTPSECATQTIDGGTISGAFASLNGWAMDEDQGGRIWIGSNTNGVYALANDGSLIVNITPGNSGGALRSPSVRAIAADGNRVWIGHETLGLQLLDTHGDPANTSGFTWTPARNLPENSVVDIALSGSDAWVLTSANLSLYKADIKFEQHALSTDGEPRSGRALAVDKRGNKWVATSSGALRLGRDGSTTVFTTANSDLIDDDLYDVGVDPKSGDILFLARGGTSRLRPGASSSGSATDLYLYPNPLRYDGTTRVKLGGGTADNALVTDLAGRSVTSFAVADGWDGRGADGEPVAPGLYLVVVDGDRVLKLAVLR